MAKKTTKKTRAQIPSNLKRMQYEKLYGFYCTGVACGLSRKMANLPPNPNQPHFAWAFTYGMRYACNPMLSLDGFKRELTAYFKQSR